jgi:hypothetical protein
LYRPQGCICIPCRDFDGELYRRTISHIGQGDRTEVHIGGSADVPANRWRLIPLHG